MINFFRKIRKKLADQNQFVKYSRYAIGEIVLVMVGILLALQVNNWNLSRLETNEAKNYLSRLSEDLKKDTIYLNNVIEHSKRESDSLSHFLTRMHEKQESHFELINLLQMSEWNPRNIHIQDNTFLEMNSSGKFDLITSDELKAEIIDYYTVRDFAYEHIAATTQHGFEMFMNLYPELTRYYSYNELKQYDIFDNNDWHWINDSNNSKFKLLAASVSHFRYKANLTNDYYVLLSKRARNILVLIEDMHNN